MHCFWLESPLYVRFIQIIRFSFHFLFRALNDTNAFFSLYRIRFFFCFFWLLWFFFMHTFHYVHPCYSFIFFSILLTWYIFSSSSLIFVFQSKSFVGHWICKKKFVMFFFSLFSLVNCKTLAKPINKLMHIHTREAQGKRNMSKSKLNRNQKSNVLRRLNFFSIFLSLSTS